MKLSKCFAVASALATIALAAETAGAVPVTTSFTARISENGEPVNAAITLNFKIYDDPSAGSLVWEETQTASASNGLVYAQMGSVDPTGNGLDTSVFDGSARWLEVSVNGTTQSPRLEIGSVPYAIKASDADTVGGRAASSLQERVSGMCSAGSSIRQIDVNGSVTCEPDTDTNTTYTAGTGLNLNGTQFSANTSYLQRRVGMYCVAGYAIRRIYADGTVLCEQDNNTNTTYTAGTGLNLNSTTFSVDTAYLDGRYLNGSSYGFYPAITSPVLIAPPGGNVTLSGGSSWEFCALAYNGGNGTCQVYLSSGNWTLRASAGSSASAACRMICLNLN